MLYAMVLLAGSCRKNEADGTVRDIDGNVYTTLVIGTQEWLGENLKSTRFSDGRTIPLVPGYTAWMSMTTPACCFYRNDPEAYKDIFGLLYNWHAAGDPSLCPAGWHVPSEKEWTELIEYLGGDSVAGGKLKAEGTIRWNSPNIGASNISGFSAQPGGNRDYDGSYSMIGLRFSCWSSTEYNWRSGWSMNIDNYESRAKSIAYGKTMGMSVRCIRNK